MIKNAEYKIPNRNKIREENQFLVSWKPAFVLSLRENIASWTARLFIFVETVKFAVQSCTLFSIESLLWDLSSFRRWCGCSQTAVIVIVFVPKHATMMIWLSCAALRHHCAGPYQKTKIRRQSVTSLLHGWLAYSSAVFRPCLFSPHSWLSS